MKEKMADIAILVAEEYERRMKSSRKNGEEEIEMFSCVGVMGQRFKGSSSSSWIKAKLLIVKEEEKMVKGFEPRSKITAAATNGFFSA